MAEKHDVPTSTPLDSLEGTENIVNQGNAEDVQHNYVITPQDRAHIQKSIDYLDSASEIKLGHFFVPRDVINSIEEIKETHKRILLTLCLDMSNRALERLDLGSLDELSNETVASALANCNPILGDELNQMGNRFHNYGWRGKEIDMVMSMSGSIYESYGSTEPAYDLFEYLSDQDSMNRVEATHREITGISIAETLDVYSKNREYPDSSERKFQYCKDHSKEYYERLLDGLHSLIDVLQPVVGEVNLSDEYQKLSRQLKEILSTDNA